MPDGIRLEGSIDNSVIRRNLMCGNDGAGIFLFKPEGAATIQDNTIKFNGQRLRRAAIYLMGDGHRVTGNTINNQKGSGVVVTAFGHGSRNPSHRNLIQTNRFTNLEGLSIDLNTRRHSSAQDFQRGDGPNPVRNSDNRRLDTGNLAINAPQFLSPEFFVMDQIREKQLVEVLPDSVDANVGLFAVYLKTRHETPKVRAFVDFLASYFDDLNIMETENTMRIE